MKKLLFFTAVFLFSFAFVGCSNAKSDILESVAVISPDHGYADTFTPERFKNLQADNKKFIVFVGANWCPGCARLTQEIHANQNVLPANTAVLTADFDTHIDLRREYGVAVKHTALYFDENGKHIKTQPSVLMKDLLAYLSGTDNEQ